MRSEIHWTRRLPNQKCKLLRSRDEYLVGSITIFVEQAREAAITMKMSFRVFAWPIISLNLSRCATSRRQIDLGMRRGCVRNVGWGLLPRVPRSIFQENWKSRKTSVRSNALGVEQGQTFVNHP